jgi:radical SAM protein with 4Fe4S-binding SPASM domain
MGCPGGQTPGHRGMECIGVPEIGMGEWSKRLLAQLGPERLPLVGSLELTYRCNMACVQCYCNLPANDEQALSEELSSDEICAILDQAAERGCLWLMLTGGEPLLRPDFVDVYTFAKKRGMLVTLFTNGTLLNEEKADYLAEWPPRKVEITLHGVTRQTFESVSRVPGSYDRCMRGIELLLERDIRLSLKTTVTTLNVHELWETKAYVEALGLDFRFDALLMPRLDGSRLPHEVRLTPQQVVELDLQDEKRSQEMERAYRQYWGLPTDDRLYSCGGGKRSFHVDPYGDLCMCLTNHAHTYDLRKGSFEEGWRDFIPAVRSLKAEKTVKCRTCPAMSLCGQCPAWSYLEHGDLETPVEYLCSLGRRRARVFRAGYQREGNGDEQPAWQEAV